MNNDLCLYLDVQQVVESETIPSPQMLQTWIKTALLEEADYCHRPVNAEYELTVRIVDKEEIRTLNHTYRHKDKATNVLSFPFEALPELQLPLLGDLVICHEVVLEEAQQQHKSITEHWAHMVIHGLLHLKGYDHIDDADARVMEALEVRILASLGIDDPYH